MNKKKVRLIRCEHGCERIFYKKIVYLKHLSMQHQGKLKVEEKESIFDDLKTKSIFEND